MLATPADQENLIWTRLAESSPGRQSWVDVTRTDLVPLGTAETLCSRVQPSLTGLIGIVSDFPGLTSWAILSRPFGTQYPNSYADS